jgi:KDEL-tailed cysteine endopeptidase
MQKVFIIFALLALSAIATPVNMGELKTLWSSWKIYYGKAYGLAEEAARLAIFVENYKKVISFNAENDDVKLAMNKFADLTAEEFSTVHAGCYNNGGKTIDVPAQDEDFVGDLPASVDWRTQGAVTPVKNQGQCGSCWSFSTTGALEGLYYLNKKKLLSFSEQQIVDCDTKDSGCNGGLPYQAMQYTAQAGLEAEDDYPYTAQDGTCTYKKLKAYNVNSNYKLVTTRNPTALKTALVNQPVSIAIEADQNVFQLYSTGVIKKKCGANLDHAVLAVGYTTINGDEAFIVKNSWGTDWGNQGYVYISTDGKANNGNGVCGILGQPVIPVA